MKISKVGNVSKKENVSGRQLSWQGKDQAHRKNQTFSRSPITEDYHDCRDHIWKIVFTFIGKIGDRNAIKRGFICLSEF